MPGLDDEGELHFDMIGDRVLTIGKSVNSRLHTFRQTRNSDHESGGILLGRIFEKDLSCTVDEITTPTKPDRSSRHSFYRSNAHHKIAVDRWKKSDGTCIYLGLWHTHPEPDPSPSKVDFNDWKKAIVKGKFEGDSLLFAIVGTKKIRCWQGIFSYGNSPLFHRLERR